MPSLKTAFKPTISLSQCLIEPSLFGSVFAGPSFWTWRTLGKVIDCLSLTEPREIELFRQCTGRTRPLNTTTVNGPRLRRFIVLVGRRGGKDRFFSAVAVWRAALCCDWRRHLSAGEQNCVVLLGKDKKQAAILRSYCRGLLRVPALAREVKRETRDVIEFRNNAVLEIASNDASLVRGRSAVAVIGSEACHWKHDEHSASNDEEVVAAAEPSMGMCPDGGLLLLGSSVHRQRGYCFRKYRELHGNDAADDICWFAPSRIMNSHLPESVVSTALAEDPHRGAAEFNNTWREDLSDFIPLEAVENCTDFGVHERPPQSGVKYFSFCDSAGGTGADSFTLSIAHYDRARDTVIVDVLREYKPRFVPRAVITELAQLLKAYGVSSVMSDNFAGNFHADEWLRASITFRSCPRTTSENYLFALPLLLSGRARLVDNATLRSQLASLERHALATGEVVRHPAVASAHDDLATSVCGVIVMVQRVAQRPKVPIAPPTLFSTRTGETLVGPQASPAGAARTPREIAMSPTPAPPGYNRPSYLEPWFPYVTGMGRWPGS